MAMSFYNAFELPVIVVRPFNTYGPRQSARAIIPTIITQIMSGMKEIRLGDLSPTRDFNYVKDTCRGFIELSNCDQAIGQEINICSNYEISMRDTFELVARLMLADVKFIEDAQRLRPAGSEVFRLWGDNTKLKSLTGFKDMGIEESGLDKLIKASYSLLELISFLTTGEDETRAWTIKKGTKVPQAGGKIHTDFEKGFIRAETIAYDKLMECEGSLSTAKEKGLLRLEGKD